jgi:hypothetical protein
LIAVIWLKAGYMADLVKRPYLVKRPDQVLRALIGIETVSSNDPRKHHIVPQFFLRNFAVDEGRTKVTAVAKEGSRAVWAERSIKRLGYEYDFYVHIERGRPVSVETDINRTIEIPISQSDTWAKIVSGRSDALDKSDRPILYALVRHLEARTPHFRATAVELSEMAADPSSGMPFTEDEHQMYALWRKSPGYVKFLLNTIVTDRFDRDGFDSAFILVMRSPIRLRTSTTPTITVSTPRHGAIDLPLSGTVPFGRMLTVNPYTLVTVVDGDFGGHFSNRMIDEETAININRNFAGFFANFPQIRHLVTGRERLIVDMAWAAHDVISDTPAKIVFKRTL